MSNELSELPPEVQMAMQTALSILGDDLRHSVREMQSSPMVEIADIDSPDEAELVPVEPQYQSGLRYISDRDAIPISEKYVLVMWGLSTYRFVHPRGVTFIVDNSRFNVERDRQYRDTMIAATDLAQSEGLPFVYVLD